MDIHILVVDDEPEIADLVGVYLRSEGFTVHTSGTAKEALDTLARQSVDLAILDVMLPDKSGFDLCGELRREHRFPVLMLTAKSSDMDKITGLTIGADDYITKPFNPIEVLARVKSQLRRYTTLGGRQRAQDAPQVLRNGGIALDDAAKSVTVDGEKVSLTPIEYNILLLLMKNPGRVFSSGQIYELVWNDLSLGSEGTVAVHIRHLREKLEIDPSDPRYIKVVWGLGYKMEKASS